MVGRSGRAEVRSSELWFQSGRQALFALFVALRNAGSTEAWFPEYHCRSMVIPSKMAGLNARFYRVDSGLQPDLEQIGCIPSDALVIGVHFFGFSFDFSELAEVCNRRGSVLIEDAAHVDLVAGNGKIGSYGTYLLSCPRKYWDIYDGAFVRGPSVTLNTIRQRGTTLSAQARCAASLFSRTESRIFVDGRSSPPGVPQSPHYVDERFVVDARTRSTTVSRLMRSIRSFDASVRRERGARIYEQLRSQVDAMSGAESLFADASPATVPYVYPVLLREPDKYLALRECGINVRRWDQLEGSPTRATRRMSLSLVQLPCTPNMDRLEMQRLCGELTRIVG